MIAVGDSNQVFLFEVKHSEGYRMRHTITSNTEAGFSCCWDRSGNKFATACQDGYCCVWDVRMLNKKLANIPSSQQGIAKGACRVVKFSQEGPTDLLAFMEHTNYVNIIDTRTFDGLESIRVSAPEIDIQLTGLSFSESSKRLIVGMEHQVFEYEIDLRRRRCFPYSNLL